MVNSEEERDEAISARISESELSIELDEEGVCIKADTVGGGPGEGAFSGGRRPHQSA